MDKNTAIAILSALGVDTSPKKLKPGGSGKYLYSLCPLHDDSDPSFSITLSSGGSWRCFGCGARGKSLGRLIDEMEGKGSQTTAREIWERDLEPWRKAHDAERKSQEEKPRGKVDLVEAELAKLDMERKEAKDSRLKFEYSVMDEKEYRRHSGYFTYFTSQRGLTERTCQYWDLGDDQSMRRALIPIRDFKGSLVGVQGRTYAENCRCGMPFDRWADDPRAKKSKRGKVKYCPSCGEMRPVKYLTTKGFHKEFLLFGEHMADLDNREAIIVESPMSVLWLWQHGYPNALATMGMPSQYQTRKMLAWFHRIFLFADGDPKLSPNRPPAGIQWARDIKAEVGRHVILRGHLCSLGQDPADLAPEELEKVLGPPPGVRDDIRTHAKDSPGRQAEIHYF